MIPWSPLARGRLARPWEQKDSTDRAGSDEFGKTLYTANEDADRKVIAAVGEIASGRGVPRAQVALAWMISKPYITSPIVGATRAEHLDDAIAAVSLKLTEGEIHRLEAAYQPKPIAGFS